VKPYYSDDLVTIYHGDCREWMPEADAVITDPPYGVDVQYGDSYTDERAGYWGWFRPVVGQMRASAPVVAFTHTSEALRYITDWDWLGCWHKPVSFSIRIGNSPIVPHWEPIFMFGIHSLGVQRDALHDVITASPVGNNTRLALFGRERRAQSVGDAHPVVKPMSLFSALVAGLTDVSAVVLDPFMGSGTPSSPPSPSVASPSASRSKNATAR